MVFVPQICQIVCGHTNDRQTDRSACKKAKAENVTNNNPAAALTQNLKVCVNCHFNRVRNMEVFPHSCQIVCGHTNARQTDRSSDRTTA